MGLCRRDGLSVLAGLAGLAWLLLAGRVAGAPPGFRSVPAFLPAGLAQARPLADLAATNQIPLAIGLPLQHRRQLDQLIRELFDPRSANYHRFLPVAEFTARFGPTPAEYAAVAAFAESHGLRVVGRQRNRLVLDVAGPVAAVQAAFQVHFHTYRHPQEARDYFAPDGPPSVPANLPVADVWGLTDYARPRPQAVLAEAANRLPVANNGSAPNGQYCGADFRHAYAAGTPLTGAGQTVALAEFDGYYPADIAAYEAQCGYAPVALTNVLVDGASGAPGYSLIQNAVLEVSLDIEMAIAMAPGLSKVVVYEGNSPYDVYNQIATDRSAAQVSCSWLFNSGPATDWTGNNGTLDAILSEMVAQGQAFFQSSGDADAYTGAAAFSQANGPIPADSVYVTSVGGTSLNMRGSGAGYASESVWNWGNNTGTGGGVSTNYPIPAWQAPVPMTNNQGSPAFRNIPDVALTAEGVYVIHDNGQKGGVGGTSCAAPLWAGFCALVNQQFAGTTPGGGTAGFLNPALYAIGLGSNYPACFNDITTGNNIGTNTPQLYAAAPGYDLCTGWGTPSGTNLINALAPPELPDVVIPPAGLAAATGTSAQLQAVVLGAAPLSLQWQFNGVALADNANITGATSNFLTLSGVSPAQTGGYALVVTNVYGAVTSSVASLQVGDPPMVTLQPSNVTVQAGASVQFAAAATGSPPLGFDWERDGLSLAPDRGIYTGTTSNLLRLAGVAVPDGGAYRVVVTNLYGAATSAPAALLVYVPPAITTSSVTNQTVECGTNRLTFGVTVTGSPAPGLQWSLDGAPVAGATNLSLTLVNLHAPGHAVAVVAANPYGAATNQAVITVVDTRPPVITINGPNPMDVELGGGFTDPGATAGDLCDGSLPVQASGLVNASVVGSYARVYQAMDASSNTAAVTRVVLVRDTTPPVIVASFTNLTLVTGADCTATMPDVTGTNDVVATDLSLPLVITQQPTNGTLLPPGSNAVILAVADAYGNTAYVTNQVVVQDGTPPVIVSAPGNQTNLIGQTAVFQVGATACTPLSYQWAFATAWLAGETNATLVRSNLTLALAGNYSVQVSSAGGAVTSDAVSLVVTLIPAGGPLVSSEDPSGFKDPVTWDQAVAPSGAGGTVAFFTNGASFDLEPVVAGHAVSAPLAALPRGADVITAVYSGDANDLGFTNLLVQTVTNHPPTAMPVVAARAAGASLTIALATLAAGWSDVDGDTVSLAGLEPSTNGVQVVTNTTGGLRYVNSNNVPDQFNCLITDGFGGTNTQTVSVSVVFPGVNLAGGGGGGSISLNLSGVPGQSYLLETRTNLALPGAWQPLATNVIGANGLWQFTDSPGAGFSQLFYRLTLAP